MMYPLLHSNEEEISPTCVLSWLIELSTTTNSSTPGSKRACGCVWSLQAHRPFLVSSLRRVCRRREGTKMVHCALLVSSTHHKHSTGGQYNNGEHLDRGREKAGTLQSHFFGGKRRCPRGTAQVISASPRRIAVWPPPAPENRSSSAPSRPDVVCSGADG